MLATFVCFYIVLNGANMIFDMFGVRESSMDLQGAVGDKAQGRVSKFDTGMA